MIFNILTISPVGIGIVGEMFKNIFWLQKIPEINSLIVLKIEILLYFGVPDHQILLRFGVPNNQILLYFGVPDNCSMNISSQPNGVKFQSCKKKLFDFLVFFQGFFKNISPPIPMPTGLMVKILKIVTPPL